ncbi:hypothetical protein QE177_04370 [Arsenophonus sp. aPb]|uniref:hypothetical protein n=1 Tax=Arsenophonus sp. aPb TaxID=3041619 RepID=UPI002468C684|nr:hypothetical protein [Arsenophonus sp. aPb]WGL99122.1 hypothetical protein QE177_04370 [Arsenophonus sp. aPb]
MTPNEASLLIFKWDLKHIKKEREFFELSAKNIEIMCGNKHEEKISQLRNELVEAEYFVTSMVNHFEKKNI